MHSLFSSSHATVLAITSSQSDQRWKLQVPLGEVSMLGASMMAFIIMVCSKYVFCPMCFSILAFRFVSIKCHEIDRLGQVLNDLRRFLLEPKSLLSSPAVHPFNQLDTSRSLPVPRASDAPLLQLFQLPGLVSSGILHAPCKCLTMAMNSSFPLCRKKLFIKFVVLIW